MPGWLGLASGVVDVAGSILGNSNDAGRFRGARDLADRAIAGDDNAFIKLKCLSGDQSARAEAIRRNLFPGETVDTCGYATEAAREYARSMVAEVNLRRGGATVAGTVASGAAQVGMGASPTQFLGTVAGNVGNAIGFTGIPPVVLYGGLALLAWWLLKGRK